MERQGEILTERKKVRTGIAKMCEGQYRREGSRRCCWGVCTWKTYRPGHTRTADSNMGVVRKRKANKYLLTQQKWRRAVHWWKQKAEDEERHTRKLTS